MPGRRAAPARSPRAHSCALLVGVLAVATVLGPRAAQASASCPPDQNCQACDVMGSCTACYNTDWVLYRADSALLMSCTYCPSRYGAHFYRGTCFRACPEEFPNFSEGACYGCPRGYWMRDIRNCLPCHASCAECWGPEADQCTVCSRDAEPGSCIVTVPTPTATPSAHPSSSPFPFAPSPSPSATPTPSASSFPVPVSASPKPSSLPADTVNGGSRDVDANPSRAPSTDDDDDGGSGSRILGGKDSSLYLALLVVGGVLVGVVVTILAIFIRTRRRTRRPGPVAPELLTLPAVLVDVGDAGAHAGAHPHRANNYRNEQSSRGGGADGGGAGGSGSGRGTRRRDPRGDYDVRLDLAALRQGGAVDRLDPVGHGTLARRVAHVVTPTSSRSNSGRSSVRSGTRLLVAWSDSNQFSAQRGNTVDSSIQDPAATVVGDSSRRSSLRSDLPFIVDDVVDDTRDNELPRPSPSAGAARTPGSAAPATAPSTMRRASEMEQLCVICTDARATNVLAPCGHRCLCDDCRAPFFRHATGQHCPLCRMNVTGFIRVQDPAGATASAAPTSAPPRGLTPERTGLASLAIELPRSALA